MPQVEKDVDRVLEDAMTTEKMKEYASGRLLMYDAAALTFIKGMCFRVPVHQWYWMTYFSVDEGMKWVRFSIREAEVDACGITPEDFRIWKYQEEEAKRRRAVMDEDRDHAAQQRVTREDDEEGEA